MHLSWNDNSTNEVGFGIERTLMALLPATVGGDSRE